MLHSTYGKERKDRERASKFLSISYILRTWHEFLSRDLHVPRANKIVEKKTSIIEAKTANTHATLADNGQTRKMYVEQCYIQ